jgi:ABC-type nitrate/sulfonate/bicarbonate transport system permease component
MRTAEQGTASEPAAITPPPAPRSEPAWFPLVPPLVTIGALLALWEAAPRIGWVLPTLVPPVSEVLAETGHVLTDSRFWDNVLASAGPWSMGVGLAVVVGIPLGVVMGRNRIVFHLVDPILTLSYPIPRAVFVLVFAFWWGQGLLPMAVTIALGAIIPVVISSYHGAAGVQPHLIWSARSLGTGRMGVLGRVVLPAALPRVLNGLRLGLIISLFVLIGSDLLVRSGGIGTYLFSNYQAGQKLTVWSCALLIAVGGFLLDTLYVTCVRRTVRWLEGEI